MRDQQDALRYTLCAIAPESKDSDFSWSDFQTKKQQRIGGYFWQFYQSRFSSHKQVLGGKVPRRHRLDSYDSSVFNEAKTFPEKIGRCIEHHKFREAQTELMNLARLGNQYLADTEPWKLKKIDETQSRNNPKYLPYKSLIF